MFDLSSDSYQNFFISAVHADSELEMTSVSKGHRIELIIRSKWNSPAAIFYPPLSDISSFLVALKKLRKILNAWRNKV